MRHIRVFVQVRGFAAYTRCVTELRRRRQAKPPRSHYWKHLFTPMPTALKEWAVTVRALAEGEQLVTLRKGGVREPGRHFELEHRRFFLYPTFDHQAAALVRESHVPEVGRAIEDATWPDEPPTARMLAGGAEVPQPLSVRIRAWADVAAAWETSDPSAVEALSRFHVWSGDYAVKRLKWKPRDPLHVLMLRVHLLPRPITVKVSDTYLGCRSWIQLEREIAYEGTPVLSDEEFSRARAQIEQLLGQPSIRAEQPARGGRAGH